MISFHKVDIGIKWISKMFKAFPGGSDGKAPTMWETRVWSLGREDPLEKEMATHSSILAWKIPWTEELGWVLSMRSQRVRHDWTTSLSLSKMFKTILILSKYWIFFSICVFNHKRSDDDFLSYHFVVAADLLRSIIVGSSLSLV